MANGITTSTKPKSHTIQTRTYNYSLDLIKFINQLPNKHTYWTISDQLLRSGTSIGANIIEAKASSSKRDFLKFYQIALKSANETKYWLYLLKDSGLTKTDQTTKLLSELDEICKMLASSVLTLKGKRKI